jgi:hypothetical protein
MLQLRLNPLFSSALLDMEGYLILEQVPFPSRCFGGTESQHFAELLSPTGYMLPSNLFAVPNFGTISTGTWK